MTPTVPDGPGEPPIIKLECQWRYFNDAIVTRKASDALTLVTKANLVRDGYAAAGKSTNGFGAARYASYSLTETLALNVREESWRDDDNFFVASFPSNSSIVAMQQGFTSLIQTALGRRPPTGRSRLVPPRSLRCRSQSPSC